MFHIRQAQAYWANQWTAWDPKITTPPGLFVILKSPGDLLCPLIVTKISSFISVALGTEGLWSISEYSHEITQLQFDRGGFPTLLLNSRATRSP